MRKHRDPRAMRREQIKARRKSAHKQRSGFHADTKRKEEEEWIREVEETIPYVLKG